MNRVALALTMAFFGFSAHATVNESSLYEVFRAFAGEWSGRTQPINLTYVVSEDGIRVEGESCRRDAEGCRPISEGYFIEHSRLLHDYPNYGVKPVDIVEIGEGKLVRIEQSPVLLDRSQKITEELIDHGQTLLLTIEHRVNGRDERKLRQQILLDRVAR